MNLFAYGTLMWPEVLEAVIGRRLTGTPSVLNGFLRKRVKGESYPALVPSQSRDVVEGILYRNITDAEFRRLDRFEGDEYDRMNVQAGRVPAQVYVLGHGWRHIADIRSWKPEDMQKEQLEAFCSDYKGWRNA